MTTATRARMRHRVDLRRPRTALIGCTYERLSKQPGHKQNVRVQRADNLDFAAAEGIKVDASFVDDGRTGYDPNVVREDYARLLAYLRDHTEVNTLVVYSLSRLTRNRQERLDFLETFAPLGLVVMTAQGDRYNLGTPNGRNAFMTDGDRDTLSSETTSTLSVREARARAMTGKASSYVAYGWRRVATVNSRGLRTAWHDEEDPRAAEIVREIVRRIGDGDPIVHVRTDLNERRVPTPREALRLEPGDPWVGAGVWNRASVRELATRRANIGVRTYHGELLGDADAPAIVDPAAHARAGAVLGDPKRRTTRPGARSHLLTYSPRWATCGLCDSQLRVQRIRGRGMYVCVEHQHVSRDEVKVDDQVAADVLKWLAVPENRLDLSGGDETIAVTLAELEQLRSQERDLGTAFAAGQITLAQLAAKNETLIPALDRAMSAVADATRRTGVEDLLNLTPERWAGWTVAKRRTALETLGVRVRLLPTRQGPVFRPEDVEVKVGPRSS